MIKWKINKIKNHHCVFKIWKKKLEESRTSVAIFNETHLWNGLRNWKESLIWNFTKVGRNLAGSAERQFHKAKNLFWENRDSDQTDKDQVCYTFRDTFRCCGVVGDYWPLGSLHSLLGCQFKFQLLYFWYSLLLLHPGKAADNGPKSLGSCHPYGGHGWRSGWAPTFGWSSFCLCRYFWEVNRHMDDCSLPPFLIYLFHSLSCFSTLQTNKCLIKSTNLATG